MTAIALTSVPLPEGQQPAGGNMMPVSAAIRVRKSGNRSGATLAPWLSDWIPLWSDRSAAVCITAGAPVTVKVWAIAKLVLDVAGAPDFGASTKCLITTVSVTVADGGFALLDPAPYPYILFEGTAAYEATVWGVR